MTDMHRSEPGVEAVVETAVNLGCQIATILNHMETSRAAGASAPDAPPPGEVLRTLLHETVTAALSEAREADLLRAAHVVRTVATTIEREILLVDPSEVQRPSHLHRRRRRR
jgi:hypothetical protein